MTINPVIETKLPEDNAVYLAILYAISLDAPNKLYYNCKEELRYLIDNRLIELKDGKFVLKHEVFIENSIKYRPIDIQIVNRAEEFRAVFSKDGLGKEGLKIGSMGDKQAIIKKLKKWFRLYPDKTMDDVLATAKFYVESFNGDYKYMKQADYFIEKDGQSVLSALIDESKERTEVDWTTTMV